MSNSLSADLRIVPARATTPVRGYLTSYLCSLLIFTGLMTGALGICSLLSLTRML